MEWTRLQISVDMYNYFFAFVRAKRVDFLATSFLANFAHKRVTISSVSKCGLKSGSTASWTIFDPFFTMKRLIHARVSLKILVQKQRQLRFFNKILFRI